MLDAQLQVFITKFIGDKEIRLRDVIEKLKLLTHEERHLLSQVVILVRLMLVVPATNAISECSFSSLRRVKTYLRSTMNQDRLNHLMILNVHKTLTDKLNLIDVANQFVEDSEHRLALFGKFKLNDTPL